MVNDGKLKKAINLATIVTMRISAAITASR